MGLLSITLIGFGLSMDAFAVSVTNGMTIKNLKPGDALKISLFFGIFQALMPLIGWAIGLQFKNYIVSVDHWIAFALLCFIGIKMIYEAMNNKEQDEDEKSDKALDNKNLFMLAIATSIDALAVGVSFAFLQISIIKSILLIGIITLGSCFIGVYIGKQFGGLLKKHAEVAGGVILILIGLKILLEHLNVLSF